ncbi:hypothetical protein C2W62_17005 [Candidatus Entotheonella serta]|nr:hypothetical protein C2W62_17005 [Candidatus Entotheonella serta]
MKLFKHIFSFMLCAVLLLGASAHAAQVRLSWKAPKTPPEFAKYRIHWGVKSGEYTQRQDVKKGTTTVTISNLKNNETYYFAATAVTSSGQESKYSNEVNVRLKEDTTRDTDKDGIPDHEENTVYGTDPNKADTDGDGINDGAEVALWKDAWNQDNDGDGLINLLDRDADGDNVSDGAEIADGTEPLDKDSFLDDSDTDLELLPVISM